MEEDQPQPEFLDFIKAAFLNQYNLIIAGGLLVFALLSGTLAIFIPIWMGVEIMLVLGLATSEKFQQGIQLEWEQNAHLSHEILLNQIPDTYVKRYQELKTCYAEIRRSTEGSGASESMIAIWQSEIDKLSYVLSSYLKLSHYLFNLNQLLSSFNSEHVSKNIDSVEKRLDRCSDSLKVQYQKYLEILKQRIEKASKATEISEAIRVQLNIIEEQFKLIQQQIFLVKNPQELTDQLDFLVSGINDLESQGTLIMDLQAELAKLTPEVPKP